MRQTLFLIYFIPIWNSARRGHMLFNVYIDKLEDAVCENPLRDTLNYNHGTLDKAGFRL